MWVVVVTVLAVSVGYMLVMAAITGLMSGDPQEGDVAPPIKTFTVGSTMEEVRAAQGEPFLPTARYWSYRDGNVYFDRSGRVERWENATGRLRGRELSVASRIRKSVEGIRADELLAYHHGDSRASVVAAEGMPDAATDDEFRYGDSRIVFRDGRIAAVFPSKDRPLRYWRPTTSFMAGSSMADVIRVQGMPSRWDGSHFFYGDSVVEFSGGSDSFVTRWEQKTVPLKVEEIQARLP
jgi:hypothetical protein